MPDSSVNIHINIENTYVANISPRNELGSHSQDSQLRPIRILKS